MMMENLINLPPMLLQVFKLQHLEEDLVDQVDQVDQEDQVDLEDQEEMMMMNQEISLILTMEEDSQKPKNPI
jgi:hypothetical protein